MTNQTHYGYRNDCTEISKIFKLVANCLNYHMRRCLSFFNVLSYLKTNMNGGEVDYLRLTTFQKNSLKESQWWLVNPNSGIKQVYSDIKLGSKKFSFSRHSLGKYFTLELGN